MARMHILPIIFLTSVSALCSANEVLTDSSSIQQNESLLLHSGFSGGISGFVNGVNALSNQDDSLNSQLSLMDMVVSTEFSANTDNNQETTPLFAIASQYHLTPSTLMAVRYNNGEKQDIAAAPLNLKESETSQREIVELAVKHQFNNDLALIANANWKNWNTSNDDLNVDYENTFGAGTAISYQAKSWILQTEVSVDSTPVSYDNNASLLGLNEQWRLGFGGVKKLRSNMSLGMSYQYQSTGHAQVGQEGLPVSATFLDGNIHSITTTLSF